MILLRRKWRERAAALAAADDRECRARKQMRFLLGCRMWWLLQILEDPLPLPCPQRTRPFESHCSWHTINILLYKGFEGNVDVEWTVQRAACTTFAPNRVLVRSAGAGINVVRACETNARYWCWVEKLLFHIFAQFSHISLPIICNAIVSSLNGLLIEWNKIPEPDITSPSVSMVLFAIVNISVALRDDWLSSRLRFWTFCQYYEKSPSIGTSTKTKLCSVRT